MVAVLKAPVGAIDGEIFGVYKDTFIIVLDINDVVNLQVLVRDSGVLQDDITKRFSGFNGLVDRLFSPGLAIPAYQELLTV